MQPIEIPLNSPINTKDDGLLSQEPAFERKNSLVFKGVASNITYSQGEGVLSTTGKHLYVDENNTIHAGEQSFTIPDNSYTVQDITSNEIGTEEVAIDDVSAGVSARYAYISNVEVPFLNTEDTTSVSTWISPIHQTEYFIAWKNVVDYNEFVIFDKEGTVINRYTLQNNLHWGNGSSTILGKDLSATYVEQGRTTSDYYAIGFDDEDVRRRITFFYSTDGDVAFIRGIGCIGGNQTMYGEPIPVLEYYLRAQTDPNPSSSIESVFRYFYTDRKWYIGNKTASNSKFMAFSGFMPDITSLTDYYRILPNGVISLWNGPAYPGCYVPGMTETNLLTLVTNNNAQLGSSLDTTDGTQSNFSGGTEVDKWSWKAHCHTFSTGGFHCDIQLFNHTSGYDPDNPQEVSVDGAESWLISQDTWGSEEDYYGTPNDTRGNRIVWYWDYDIASGRPTSTQVANADHEFLMQDNELARSGAHVTYMFGDWTYVYDSMKSAANTTDYDGIFPVMRLFFNNSTARNKYWEYDNTHSKFYITPFGFSCSENELLFFRLQQVISTGNAFDVYGTIYETVTQLNKGAQITSFDTKSFLDCLGNSYHIGNQQTHNDNKAWTNRYVRFNCSDDKFGGIFENAQHVPYSGWVYESAETDNWNRETPQFHPLKIRGDGQGVFEETFAIGGMGDNSVLPSINIPTVANGAPFSLNSTATRWIISGNTIADQGHIYRYDDDISEKTVIAPNTNTQIQCNNQISSVNYSSLQIGLAMLGTLIFNADDMNNKWHYYTDSNGDIHLTIYNGKRSQSCRIQKNGKVIIDKLTDYMYRVNVLGYKNLLQETRNGTFSFTESFKAYLQNSVIKAINLDLTYGTDGTASNSLFYYANGINADLNDEDISPSFLMPQLTINTYIAPGDIDKYRNTVLTNKNSVIKQLLKLTNTKEAVDVYYTNSVISTDCSYKETDKLPNVYNRSQQESYIGVQSFDSDKDGSTYWIQDDPIYPTAIASEVSGVNYASSTIELPNNYAVRYYTRNNHTYNVYNQNAKVWYGQNIFTIMGSNYYFDGQGVYYIGSASSGSSAQYQDNTLIAYAIGMRYLCNAPSEAYFYSPFDKCLYIFTASNTMQKSTSLERFGDVLDSCYCPVNQSLYLLFDGKLIVKSQDDMAMFDVEGDRLYTTSEGVQVVSDEGYRLHHPYKFEDYEDLYIETEWLGNEQTLSQYSFAEVVLYSPEQINTDLEYDYLTIQDSKVEHHKNSVHIKKSDWDNGFCRIKLNPNDAIGNAFKLTLKCKDKLGVYTITNYQQNGVGIPGSR